MSVASEATDEHIPVPTTVDSNYSLREPNGRRQDIIKWTQRLIKRVDTMNLFEAEQLKKAFVDSKDMRKQKKDRKKQKRKEGREAIAALEELRRNKPGSMLKEEV